jgi:enoyl-CoA hydratase
MTYTRMNVSADQGVGRIELNQPDEYNRMPLAFWRELPRALHELDARGDVRALVLSSTGKHFSAGMDLSVFTSSARRDLDRGRAGESARRHIDRMQNVFTGLETVRMPVLAAIQGGCVGGGVDLVAACDARYCTSDAFFCIQEINIGMTADVGTLQRLPKLVPEGIVRELAYTGDRMPAARAAEIGLVNEVFEDHESMLEAVHGIAARIASKSPLAIEGTKEMINYTRDHTVDDSLKYIAAWQTGMFQPTDMLETFTAKAEGRDPEFDDLLEIRRGL